MGKKKNKENNPTYTCTPSCPYFPYINNSIEWVYDEEANCKRRANPFEYKCSYDGHIIKSWYDECPLKRRKKNENCKEISCS